MPEILECLDCHKQGTHKEMIDWDARTHYPIKCQNCGSKSNYLELVFKLVRRGGKK